MSDEAKDYCPVCKIYAIWDGTKFCSGCGSTLTTPPPKRECPHCHSNVGPNDNYCIQCGVPLEVLSGINKGHHGRPDVGRAGREDSESKQGYIISVDQRKD